MIIHSYDDRSDALIDPAGALKKEVVEAGRRSGIRVLIMVYSLKLVNELEARGLIEVIDGKLKFGSAAGSNPVYRVRGTDTGILVSGVGAPLAAAMIEETSAVLGCKRFLVFGSCGALKEIPEGKLIVPVEAYRDEGTSYHYAEAADYIRIRNAEKLCGILEELGAEFVTGRTWTTDAFYRETVGSRDKRVLEGCICVEMECSALQAVCDFRGLELYQFFYAADSLNGEWSKRILGDLEMDSRIAYFFLAVKIAEKI